MSEVDIANWYWADYTILQSQNYCYWKSLFYWLLDIVLTNSYLLVKASCRSQIEESKWYYIYWWFLKVLAKVLMIYNEILKHNQILRFTWIYCVYCWKNWNWKSKHQEWVFEANITNIKDDSECHWESKTQWDCIKYNIILCKIEDCWCLWHENLN